MKVSVEAVVLVVAAVGVDLAQIWLTMKMHLETVMDTLVATGLQKMEMVEELLLKDVHMVDLMEVGASVVVVVVASIMMKLPRVTVLAGCLIVAVELGVGKGIQGAWLSFIFFSFREDVFLCLFVVWLWWFACGLKMNCLT